MQYNVSTWINDKTGFYWRWIEDDFVLDKKLPADKVPFRIRNQLNVEVNFCWGFIFVPLFIVPLIGKGNVRFKEPTKSEVLVVNWNEFFYYIYQAEDDDDELYSVPAKVLQEQTNKRLAVDDHKLWLNERDCPQYSNSCEKKPKEIFWIFSIENTHWPVELGSPYIYLHKMQSQQFTAPQLTGYCGLALVVIVRRVVA